MTPLTKDDRFLIQILRTDEGFKSFQIFNKFPNRRWKKRKLIEKLMKQVLRVAKYANRYERLAQPLTLLVCPS